MKRNQVIKHGMYYMVSVNRHPFQIKKEQKINTAVHGNDETMLIFFEKF